MNDRKIFEKAIDRFLEWLDRNGAAGYDPYDLWSTWYGTRARRLYYRYGGAAAAVATPLVVAERLAPSTARLGVTKKPFATSHAHLVLAFLDLHECPVENGSNWLERASRLADELDRMKIGGYSGDCWGYPFDWENRRGFWPKNTPLITVTPYCFEALLGLNEATGNSQYLVKARSILQFALNDLKNTERPNGAIASSYSPLDRSLVINASAYRAFVLIKGAELFSDVAACELGNALIEFVLDSQRPDGSWLYALEAKGDDFVDHFHTCFVLKNLVKVFRVNGNARILEAIEKGYALYERALFDDQNLPKPFAEGGSRRLRYNMYDFAEAINLGVVLRDLIPRAFDRALEVARHTTVRYQLPDGHFLTSVGQMRVKNKLAFIRWPQAQMFHAMTSLLKVLK